LLTIFGVLQFRRGLNEIELETGDVVAAPKPCHARAALHAATRQTSLAPAYGPWTLCGRPCVLGGLRTTHRLCTASRREPPVGLTPSAARRLCQLRLASGRGQLAVPAGAKCLPSPRSLPSRSRTEPSKPAVPSAPLAIVLAAAAVQFRLQLDSAAFKTYPPLPRAFLDPAASTPGRQVAPSPACRGCTGLTPSPSPPAPGEAILGPVNTKNRPLEVCSGRKTRSRRTPAARPPPASSSSPTRTTLR
jgi:hypothetical protein